MTKLDSQKAGDTMKTDDGARARKPDSYVCAGCGYRWMLGLKPQEEACPACGTAVERGEVSVPVEFEIQQAGKPNVAQQVGSVPEPLSPVQQCSYQTNHSRVAGTNYCRCGHAMYLEEQ